MRPQPIPTTTFLRRSHDGCAALRTSAVVQGGLGRDSCTLMEGAGGQAEGSGEHDLPWQGGRSRRCLFGAR